MAKAERPAVIVGGARPRRRRARPALALAESWKLVREGWNGFNVLHLAARGWAR
jgi:NADH-quinone oxidoreductase subunit G